MDDIWVRVSRKMGQIWFRLRRNDMLDFLDIFSRGNHDFYWINREILFPFLPSNHVNRVQGRFE
jgi:hypothetical protein